jgi:hypothetical protein
MSLVFFLVVVFLYQRLTRCLLLTDGISPELHYSGEKQIKA